MALAVLGRNDLKRIKQNPCKENCLVTGQVRPGPWKGSLVVRWLFAFARSKMINFSFQKISWVLIKETLFMILGDSWIIAPKSLDPYFSQ